MSSRSEGDIDDPTEFRNWLVLNIVLAISVTFIYGLVTFPFIFALGMGGALKGYHLILWCAGYLGVAGVVAGVVVKRRIIASMVVWVATVALLACSLDFFS